MTFSWINKRWVRNSKGFDVQAIGRFEFCYIEGSKKLTIYIDPGIDKGRNCVIIELENLEKWDDGIPISQDKQNEILKNFTDALEFQGLGVLFYGDENK